MAKITQSSAWLANHYQANDYYSEGEKIQGEWVGELAESMGLSGAVESDDFLALMDGKNPKTGEQLRQREHAKVQGFDFQCSAQKSVSVLALVGGDDRLHDAHRAAAAVAFGELEKLAGHRSGDSLNKHVATTGKVVASVWHHDASRDLDPQIHSHFCLANYTIGRDGKPYALETADMLRAIRYAGKVYQNELRRNVEGLGYETETQRNERGQITGFEIKGVPTETLEKYSKRGASINRAAAKLEVEKGRKATAAERHVIALETRADKLKEITTDEVRAAQRAELTPQEAKAIDGLKASAMRAGNRQADMSAADLVSHTRQHFEDRHAVFTEHQLKAEALNIGMGRVDLGELNAAFASSGQIVRLDDKSKGLMAEVTTQKHVALERASIAMIDKGRDAVRPVNANFQASFGGCEWKGDKFANAEGHDYTAQKKAVEEMLASRDFVHNLRGVAGAGKTTLLQEFKKGVDEAGRALIVLAPTAAAVKVLKGEGFEDAQTLAAFEMSKDKLEAGTVIVVDEAGFLSNEHGHRLLERAKADGAVVRLVGDTRQLTGVQAGDWLRTMEGFSKMRGSELTDIRRQKSQKYREATTAMSAGDVVGGLRKLDDMGWVKESSDYISNAAADYLGRVDNGKKMMAADGKAQCLGLAPTHSENRAFTADVRAALSESGALTGESVKVQVFQPSDTTPAQRKDVREYEQGRAVTLSHGKVKGLADCVYTVASRDEKKGTVKLENEKGKIVSVNVRQDGEKLELGKIGEIEVQAGDRLRLGKNNHKAGVVNGQIITVESVDKSGTILHDGGKALPTNYTRMSHGYAVTVAAAQGATAKEAVAFGTQFKANDMYVAASRATDSMALHVPDKAKTFESIERQSGMRKSAVEAIAQKQAAKDKRIERKREAYAEQIYKVPKKGATALEKLKAEAKAKSQGKSVGQTSTAAPAAAGSLLAAKQANPQAAKEANKAQDKANTQREALKQQSNTQELERKRSQGFSR